MKLDEIVHVDPYVRYVDASCSMLPGVFYVRCGRDENVWGLHVDLSVRCVDAFDVPYRTPVDSFVVLLGDDTSVDER